jgi:hypothetical protein
MINVITSAHERCWTSTEELCQDWDGFIVYGLPALAGMAYDYGIPFRVQSDYLPLSLVQGLGKAGPRETQPGS